tara:strand:+ start:20 stop:181 length:162 start_codon:yes stop_codon:yes gene_type:complete
MISTHKKRIDRLNKELKWYRLYADYVESHFTILGDNACDYADNKIKEETNEIF